VGTRAKPSYAVWISSKHERKERGGQKARATRSVWSAKPEAEGNLFTKLSDRKQIAEVDQSPSLLTKKRKGPKDVLPRH